MDLKTEAQYRQELATCWQLIEQRQTYDAALRKDAERYRGLRALAREGLLNIKGAQSEFLPDMRTHWLLPTLMCSGPVGGFASFDEAVDTVLHNVAIKRLP